MTDLSTKAARHTSVYALGNFLRYIVSFLMLPIYTRFLTPADYGVIELLQMAVDLIAILTGMRVGEAIMRYYWMSESEGDRRKIVGSALFLSLVLNGGGVALIVALSGPVSAGLFGPGVENAQWLLALFSLNLLVGGLAEVVLTFVRAQQRPWHIVSFGLFRLLSQLGLNILFVVGLRMHVEGVVFASVIAGGLYALVLGGYLVANGALRPSREYVRKLVGFSWPMILAAAGAFYLTFGDRYFLRLFHGLSEVGIYSLAYKFGFILLVATWEPFQMIWDSLRYEVLKREDAREVYVRVFMISNLVVIGGALGISLFVSDLLRIMATPKFYPAAAIVPVVMIAYVIQAWTNYCRFGILVKGNTLQVAYGNGVAVVVISAGYLTLIPLYGAMGAAWATVAGFAARFAWILWQAEKAYAMRLSWGRTALVCLFAGACYGGSTLFSLGLVQSIIANAAIACVFAAGVLFGGIMRSDERALLFKGVRALDPRRRAEGAAGE